MWLIILSNQLSIVALASHYLTNELMERGPIHLRKLVYRGLLSEPYQSKALVRGISPPFGRLSPRDGQVAHVLLTRAPLYRGRSPFSCDLHILGAPLTFALSQDLPLLNKIPTKPINWVS